MRPTLPFPSLCGIRSERSRHSKESVAVLIDAAAFADAFESGDAATVTIAPQANSDESIDAGVPRVLPPRPNKEMLLALVRDAVAFDTARGDTVTLSFQPFRQGPEGHRTFTPPDETAFPVWLPVTIVTVIGFVLMAVAWRISEQRRLKAEAEAKALAEAEATTATTEEPQEEPEPTESELLRERVRVVTNENMSGTLEVIRGWLSTSPQKG